MMVWRLSDAYGRLSHEVENEALDGKRLVESGADASRWDRRSFYLKDLDAGGVINNSVVCAETRDRKFLPSDKPTSRSYRIGSPTSTLRSDPTLRSGVSGVS